MKTWFEEIFNLLLHISMYVKDSKCFYNPIPNIRKTKSYMKAKWLVNLININTFFDWLIEFCSVWNSHHTLRCFGMLASSLKRRITDSFLNVSQSLAAPARPARIWINTSDNVQTLMVFICILWIYGLLFLMKNWIF